MTTIAKYSTLIVVLCLLLSACAPHKTADATVPVDTVTPSVEDAETLSPSQNAGDPMNQIEVEVQDETTETVSPPEETVILDPTTNPTPTEVPIPSLDTLANDDVVRILDYIPNAIIDLKYATEDNFTGK